MPDLDIERPKTEEEREREKQIALEKKYHSIRARKSKEHKLWLADHYVPKTTGRD